VGRSLSGYRQARGALTTVYYDTRIGFDGHQLRQLRQLTSQENYCLSAQHQLSQTSSLTIVAMGFSNISSFERYATVATNLEKLTY
jgi:hypothetical protein